MSQPFRAFKIRDPKTGLYKCGGLGVGGKSRWNKTGKTWATANALGLHFAHLRAHRSPVDPDWEIIVLSEVETTTVAKFYGDRLVHESTTGSRGVPFLRLKGGKEIKAEGYIHFGAASAECETTPFGAGLTVVAAYVTCPQCKNILMNREIKQIQEKYR